MASAVEGSSRERGESSRRDNRDPASVMCRRYMVGKCRKARKCPYSHSMEHLPTSFCKDFIFRHCKYGARCKRRHLNPREENRREVLRKKFILKKQMTWHEANNFEPGASNHLERRPLPPGTSSLEELKGEPLCQHAIEGTCENDPCMFLHGFVCKYCKKPVIHPFDRIQGRTHIELCSKTSVLLKNYVTLIKNSEVEECSICYEKVLCAEKKEEERKFGLLPGCMHKFCLPCIRRWRSCTEGTVSLENRRSCPNCRQKSYFVVPSQVWIPDGTNKKAYIDEYKKDLKRKPCKYYRHSGDCPFSTNCFYSHEQIDGQGITFTPRTERNNSSGNDEIELLDNIVIDGGQETNFETRLQQVRSRINTWRTTRGAGGASRDTSNFLNELINELDSLTMSLGGAQNNPDS